ncbi:putative carboxylesterase 18 [Apostasia shenzhenica]|uniref:Putative carboxylesterase 18 n=1 Tax=Apostasia shenzhenica TaxID=1088818 RepID=A0A2I0AK76_9ASPA|nr:putative carboxylesterase 18 [Apostasia shenzhenica]
MSEMTDVSGSPAAKQAKPKLSLKTRLYVSLLSAVTDACRRSDGSINRRLLSFFDLRAAPNPSPVHGVRTLDLTVDASRNLWVRLFLPAGQAPSTAAGGGSRLPLVIFFHGGGFAYLSPDSRGYDLVCRRMARRLSVVVASVNYRLSPEHRCPAPYDDGFDFLSFIDSGGMDAEVAELADFSSCFLAGDSAGANICHHVAHRWAAAASAGDGWKKVNLSGIILIQPYFGGEERTESEIRLTGAPLVSTDRSDWLWRAFLPKGADRDDEAANVFGPKAKSELEKDFPAAMVVVGGHDPLQDWQRRYCESLRAKGREVVKMEFPDAIHAFYIFPEISDSGRLIDEIGSFIRSRLSPALEAE